MNKINWGRLHQILKAIVIILVIVVFGILGYYQIQLNKASKKLDEIQEKVEEINAEYNRAREAYKNEIKNVEVE